MVKEAYCSYELTKLMVNKGFDPDLVKGTKISHQFAMAWLREEKRIFIRIIEDCTGEFFRYEIYNHMPDNNGNYYISNTYADSYEDAVEAALKYTLENLI